MIGGRAEGRAWANPSGGGAFQEPRVLARGDRHWEEEATRGAPEKARVRPRPCALLQILDFILWETEPRRNPGPGLAPVDVP